MDTPLTDNQVYFRFGNMEDLAQQALACTKFSEEEDLAIYNVWTNAKFLREQAEKRIKGNKL